MDAKTPQGVAGAVGTLKQLLICDAMVGAFDSDVLGAAFEDVAIHEIRGDVETLRQRDHVGSRVTEKIQLQTFLQARRLDSIRSTRFGACNFKFAVAFALSLKAQMHCVTKGL